MRSIRGTVDPLRQKHAFVDGELDDAPSIIYVLDLNDVPEENVHFDFSFLAEVFGINLTHPDISIWIFPDLNRSGKGVNKAFFTISIKTEDVFSHSSSSNGKFNSKDISARPQFLLSLPDLIASAIARFIVCRRASVFEGTSVTSCIRSI